MHIFLDKDKNGVYKFNWKERFKIFFRGSLVFSAINLKKSFNSWMTALLTINDHLPDDVQKHISHPLDEAKSK